MKIYRHGDVLLKEISKTTEVNKKLDTNILAYGEQTGHSHALVGGDFSVFETPKNSMIVQVLNTTNLVHQEHKAIPIPPGEYEVIRETEYVPQRIPSRRTAVD